MLWDALCKSKKIARSLTNVIMNYTPIEIKIRETVNDEPWGPQNIALHEIAQLTFLHENYPEVMRVIWKLLFREQSSWRRVYKTLVLLNYLLLNGSEKVILSVKNYSYDIKSLLAYHFTDEFGTDRGMNVRNKAMKILLLVKDEEQLEKERQISVTNKEKYQGFSYYSVPYFLENVERLECPQSNKQFVLGEFDSWNDGVEQGSIRSMVKRVIDRFSHIWDNSDQSSSYADEDAWKDDATSVAKLYNCVQACPKSPPYISEEVDSVNKQDEGVLLEQCDVFDLIGDLSGESDFGEFTQALPDPRSTFSEKLLFEAEALASSNKNDISTDSNKLSNQVSYADRVAASSYSRFGCHVANSNTALSEGHGFAVTHQQHQAVIQSASTSMNDITMGKAMLPEHWSQATSTNGFVAVPESPTNAFGILWQELRDLHINTDFICMTAEGSSSVSAAKPSLDQLRHNHCLFPV